MCHHRRVGPCMFRIKSDVAVGAEAQVEGLVEPAVAALAVQQHAPVLVQLARVVLVVPVRRVV